MILSAILSAISYILVYVNSQSYTVSLGMLCIDLTLTISLFKNSLVSFWFALLKLTTASKEIEKSKNKVR